MRDGRAFAFPLVVLAVTFLVFGLLGVGSAVRTYRETARFAEGEGRAGSFTAQQWWCQRGNDCYWRGWFRPDSGVGLGDGVARGAGVSAEGGAFGLRGLGRDRVAEGDEVPALDVGSREFVFAVGASPEWGRTVVPALFGSFLGVLGVVLCVVLVRRVRESGGGELTAGGFLAGRERLRGLRNPLAGAVRGVRDRWVCVPFRRSDVQVKVVRSAWWSLLWGPVFPVLALTAFALGAAGWETGVGDVYVEDRVFAALLLVVAVFVGLAAVQVGRMLFLRPRVRVTDDSLVIWDSTLFWRPVRISRSRIAAVCYPGAVERYLVPGERAQLTPFREETNLDLLLTEEIRLPGRSLVAGNWIWLCKPWNRDFGPPPWLSRRDESYRQLSIRVRVPERTGQGLERWLGDRTVSPGVPAPRAGLGPADHFFAGKRVASAGRGDGHVTVRPGSQPVIAEVRSAGSSVLRAFVDARHDGAGAVRARLDRTLARLRRAGVGRPPVVVVPGGIAQVVVGDRARPLALPSDRDEGDGLDAAYEARRVPEVMVRVESQGAWDVAFGGPELARAFDRVATGRAAEVLVYRGPPGIAVVRGLEAVRLRRDDLTPLYEEPFVARTHVAPRLGFAVPTGAVLEVVPGRPDWELEVVPVHALPGADGLFGGPGVRLVRTFTRSVRGRASAVLYYGGPEAAVEIACRGADGFGVVRLDGGFAPTEPLVPAPGSRSGVTTARLSPGTMLQVSCGTGTWAFTADRAGR